MTKIYVQAIEVGILRHTLLYSDNFHNHTQP